ncbi:MAG: hypothetical protein KKA67_04920 [Spirochaetes bacterium]|nr:hypothetical protein [Spirochaetota bacterium]MBU1082287.1 hypothetical protein [Spirochaetota bacterium]
MDVRISNHIPLAYAYGAGASGRVSVPVAPSQLLYAHFKNVSGTASPGASAYSLDKLKILDTIIERLRTVKSQPRAEREGQGLSDERIDALIQQYGQQLHSALVSSPTPYAAPTGVVPGMLVSIAA